MRTFRESLVTPEFTITAELKLPPGSNAETVVSQARLLGPVVDGVIVPDSPDARVQMSAIAASSLLIQNKVDAVPLMSCRDRNRLALQSDLLGAAALGMSSVLVMRGDNVPDGDDAPFKPVFEFGARKLIASAQAVKREQFAADVPDFFVGSVATVFRPKPTWTPDSLFVKVDAGVRFIQTQPCFNMDVLRRYMSRLVASKITWKVSVVVGIAPLPSVETALWFRENLRGSLMPDSLVKRLDQAKDAEQEGVNICSELLQELAEIPGVSGACIMAPGEPETIPAAIEASGLRA
ncbi:MAG: methylenetetrahydrofolate reductase [Gammaproteobacteria bacterium]